MSEQQFGRYSLLRRLSQDAFGSVYRAGILSGGGVAELVLLRTFDIPSSELEAVESRLRNSAVEKSTPSLPNAIDKGVVDGTPFLVYRYTSGRTLRDLMQEVAGRNATVPVEHCLFLADRVCKAAENFAHATSSSGVLFPETAYLSNDGDIQILARELAGEPITALAKSMGVDSYLAPEVRDANAAVNDDVFAIAALLREMLGDNAPDEVRSLIDDGTAVASERASLEQWRSALEQIMYARPDSSSAFNVAFFLNGLLINEIEEDARRIEAEKMALGAADEAEADKEPKTPKPEAAPSEPPVTTTAAAERQRTGVPKPVLIAAGLGVLVILAFLGWTMLRSSEETGGEQLATRQPPPVMSDAVQDPAIAPLETEGSGAESAQETTADQDAVQPADTPADATGTDASLREAEREASPTSLTQRPAGAAERDEAIRLSAQPRYSETSQEDTTAAPDLPEPPLSDAELQAQLEDLAAKKSAELEAKMRDEYEAQMAELQDRLDEAEKERERQEAERIAAQEAEEERKRREAEAEAARKAEKERLKREAAEKAAAEAAKTKPGDLVQEGPGVATAVMTKRPEPVFPRMAQRMGRSATVTVRVLVNENGQVEDVELSSDKAGFGFDEAALSAARKTEWKPAVKDGVNVKIWKSLRIVFDPNV